MANELAVSVGRVVLFVGQECQHWSVDDFRQAARFAHSLGVDTLVAKRADGGIKWYGSIATLKAERAAVLAEGCGYLAFGYCYGPKFGNDQIGIECDILAEMASVCADVMVADMEVEWNGQVDAARIFEANMRPRPERLVISTWADPLQQDWGGVIKALAPCVDAWGPQQYNAWLDAQESQLAHLGETVIYPEFDLSQEFGKNDPLANVREALARGQQSVWLWELSFARMNPALVRDICAVTHQHFATQPLQAAHLSLITPETPNALHAENTPPETPQDAPQIEEIASDVAGDVGEAQQALSHIVAYGETLASIAQDVYGDASAAARIFAANCDHLINPDALHVGGVLRLP